MGDIGNRIRRYRLSRYAPPSNPWSRRLRWLALLLVAWIVWAGLISDHSFYRLWRLEREAAAERVKLAETRAETEQLRADLKDPQKRIERAERELRRKGWIAPTETTYVVQEVTPDSLAP